MKAVKTPVLAVKATGTADIVVDGKNGYMTEEREEKFADCLMHILQGKERKDLQIGAYDTAYGYRAEDVARRAVICYAMAINHKRKKVQYEPYGKYDILSGVN